MSSAECSEPEYYFDVSSQQWWVLTPGAADWELLPAERVSELGLHSAVLHEECTFVETTLADYENALSCADNDASADCPAVSGGPSSTSPKGAEPASAGRTLAAKCDAAAGVPEGAAAAAAAPHVSRLSALNSGVDPASLPSIQYGKSSASGSFERLSSGSSSSESVATTGPDRRLDECFDGGNASGRRVPSASASRNSCSSLSNVDGRWSQTASSLASRSSRRSTMCGEAIQEQLASLLAETAEVKRGYEAKASQRLDKVESFVRSAVRHVTQAEAGGLGDCIRAVALQRERMRTMATTKAQPEVSGERYQKMIERARTLAAISQEASMRREKSDCGRGASMLADVKREVSKGTRAESSEGGAFDASSDSEGSKERTREDALHPLMSQRLSLRRTMTRLPSGVVE